MRDETKARILVAALAVVFAFAWVVLRFKERG
jgi:flagellar biogenesis protein FliO